jgi:ABC-2 type transport system permease protein
MHKFLRYEMDQYLRGRGRESEAERPLLRTEGQAYIHYSKASVVMYYLKEMLGEDKVNQALASLIADYAYKEPPYPSSMAAYRAFEAVIPDSLAYLKDDLFSHITLFSNRVLQARYEEVEGGYNVTLRVRAEKYRADSMGRESPVALADYLDLGIFGVPEGGRKLGPALWYQRIWMDEQEKEIQVMLSEVPDQAGIDPYHFLIDRIPSDNLRKVARQ